MHQELSHITIYSPVPSRGTKVAKVTDASVTAVITTTAVLSF